MKDIHLDQLLKKKEKKMEIFEEKYNEANLGIKTAKEIMNQ